MPADCVVIGAGPAGAACALFLARAGCSVTVVEARRGPKNKVCGEGLMPAGVPVLQELGLLEAVRSRGAREFRGIRYRTAGGVSAVGEFPSGRGLAMPRVVLDAVLREALAGQAGVTVLEGHVVAGVVEDGGRVRGVVARARGGAGRDVRLDAGLVVGADGLRSRLHGLSGVGVRRPARRRFGVAVHLRGIEGLRDLVEVHVVRDGELYLTPEGEDAASLALLVEEAALGRVRSPEALVREMMAAAPELRARCAGARFEDRARVYGPLGLTVARAAGPGWMLAGDAAGALDPITGEGVALALAGARALGEQARAGRLDEAACRAVAARRRELEAGVRHLTDALLFVSRRPVLADAAVRVAGAWPGVFSRLLGVAAGG